MLKRIAFSLGLLAVTAQALLFRSWLTLLQSNEIAIALFFGIWLAATALGAYCGRVELTWHRKQAPSGLQSQIGIMGVLALIITIFFFEDSLLLFIKPLLGIASYEGLLNLQLYGAASLCLSALPFLLGLGFIWLYACCKAESPNAVTKIYRYEAIGFGIGGLITTAALYANCPDWTVFCIIALAAIIITQGIKPINWMRLTALCAVGALCVILSLWLTHVINQARYHQLLPESTYITSMPSAQGTYQVGQYKNQLTVISQGTVIETRPDPAVYKNMAAVLAMPKHVERVLLIGMNGLALSEGFASLSKIKEVVWLCPDPVYPNKLLYHAFDRGLIQDVSAKIIVSDEEPSRYLADSDTQFDVVWIRIPNLGTAASARYFTTYFYRSIKEKLNPQGVLCVSVQGGENFIGFDQLMIGSSVQKTLLTVFGHSVLKPGKETILFGSDAPLTQANENLMAHVAQYPELAKLYAPQRISSDYPADRALLQQNLYKKTAPQCQIITNANPWLLFYTMITEGKETQPYLVSYLKLIQHNSKAVILIPFVLIVFYLLQALIRRRESEPRMARWLYVALNAAVAMTIHMIILFRYHMLWGNLYLWIGLLNAAFMLGIFIGGKLLAGQPRWRFWGVILGAIQIIFCICLGIGITKLPTVFLFILSISGGLFLGAAIAVSECGFSRKNHTLSLNLAQDIETADQWGGVAGAVATGLLLLPIYGLIHTCWILAAVSGLAVLALWARGPAQGSQNIIAYVLGGLILTLIGYHLFLSVPQTQETPVSSVVSLETQQVQGQLANNHKFLYQKIQRGPETYFQLDTRTLDINTPSFRGPMHIKLELKPDGRISDIALSTEDDRDYIKMLSDWLIGLRGQRVSDLTTIKAVSGATVSSEAVKAAIAACAPYVAAILKQETHAAAITVPSKAAPSPINIKWPPLALFCFCAACIPIINRWQKAWFKISYQLLIIFGLGFFLNQQYALPDVAGLLTVLKTKQVFGFLILLVPFLVLIFGNIYCAFLCPFGAAQDLIGRMGKRLGIDLNNLKIWRQARMILFSILMIIFLLTHNAQLLGVDPLITAFSHVRMLVLGLLMLSLVYSRFWCRVLCPTGAWLSLVAAISRWLRNFWRPGQDTGQDPFDPLPNTTASKSASTPRARAQVLTVLGNGLIILILAWLQYQAINRLPTGQGASGGGRIALEQPRRDAIHRVSTIRTTDQLALPHIVGHARVIDAAKIRSQISSGTLSDKKAQFWK